MKRIGWQLLAVLLVAGCSGVGGGSAIDQALGTWHQLSVVDTRATQGWARENCTFAADETVVCVEYERNRKTYRGTFTVDGDGITISLSDGIGRTGVIAGKRMVLQLVGRRDFRDLVHEKR